MKQQNETIRPRALLAGVHLNQNNDFEVSMKELHNLVKACDMDPVARVDQNLSCINAAYYIGSGKVGEIRGDALRGLCHFQRYLISLPA